MCNRFFFQFNADVCVIGLLQFLFYKKGYLSVTILPYGISMCNPFSDKNHEIGKRFILLDLRYHNRDKIRSSRGSFKIVWGLWLSKYFSEKEKRGSCLSTHYVNVQRVEKRFIRFIRYRFILIRKDLKFVWYIVLI